MNTSAIAPQGPPTAVQESDIGATDDSRALLQEPFARHGDLYRVWSPGRKSRTRVINHRA